MKGPVKELAERRAYRGFSEKAIDPTAVRRLFEAAVLAPSCANKQPWRFIAVQDPALLGQLRETFADGNYWAKKAPLVVAAWTHLDYDIRNPDGRDFALYDLGQAVMAFQVQAQAEGLVTHPFAGFDMAKAVQILGLPDGAILPALVTVAYLGKDKDLNEKHQELERGPRSRKPLEEVVVFR